MEQLRRGTALSGQRIPGFHKVKHLPLIKRSQILFPLLRIKLGMAKQFIKALKSTNLAYQHLQSIFPNVSEAKAKK